MTEHYITLFDSGFLPNGLALHASLRRHDPDSILWILCMDDDCFRVLNSLELEGVTLLRLDEVETPELLAIKPSRSVGEYCWTLTPFTADMVFDRDNAVRRVTYIDADMWFLRSPAPIFADLENSGAASLITPHAYADEYNRELEYGIYCVQFMPFVRGASDEVRLRWKAQCIDWCFADPDSGRFGDQKYLDDWPQHFGSRVRVESNPGWTQGPWNALRFPAADAITFHFHRLRITTLKSVNVGMYRLPQTHVRELYEPYLEDLRHAVNTLTKAGHGVQIQQQPLSGYALAKEKLAFRLNNWRSPFTPYSLKF
jgi:hypothetical protein